MSVERYGSSLPDLKFSAVSCPRRESLPSPLNHRMSSLSSFVRNGSGEAWQCGKGGISVEEGSHDPVKSDVCKVKGLLHLIP